MKTTFRNAVTGLLLSVTTQAAVGAYRPTKRLLRFKSLPTLAA
jgi:hypothetical protein